MKENWNVTGARAGCDIRKKTGCLSNGVMIQCVYQPTQEVKNLKKFGGLIKVKVVEKGGKDKKS